MTHYKTNIQERVLHLLSNIGVDPQGKQECIDTMAIIAATRFLKSNYMNEILNSSAVIMSCTIHLEGKKQAVRTNCLDELVNLMKNERPGVEIEGVIRKNIIQAMNNMSDLPEGFYKLTHCLLMTDKTNKLLDEVFKARSIFSLFNLLPKWSKFNNMISIDEFKKEDKFISTIEELG